MSQVAEKPARILLNEIKAANHIGVQQRTMQDWRQRKIGPPYIKLMNMAVRYDVADLDAWLDKQKVTHAA